MPPTALPSSNPELLSRFGAGSILGKISGVVAKGRIGRKGDIFGRKGCLCNSRHQDFLVSRVAEGGRGVASGDRPVAVGGVAVAVGGLVPFSVVFGPAIFQGSFSWLNPENRFLLAVQKARNSAFVRVLSLKFALFEVSARNANRTQGWVVFAESVAGVEWLSKKMAKTELARDGRDV